MWTVIFDGHHGYFPPYPTRREAIAVAREFRALWPTHRYTVAKDQDFTPPFPRRRRRWRR